MLQKFFDLVKSKIFYEFSKPRKFAIIWKVTKLQNWSNGLGPVHFLTSFLESVERRHKGNLAQYFARVLSCFDFALNKKNAHIEQGMHHVFGSVF